MKRLSTLLRHCCANWERQDTGCWCCGKKWTGASITGRHLKGYLLGSWWYPSVTLENKWALKPLFFLSDRQQIFFIDNRFVGKSYTCWYISNFTLLSVMVEFDSCFMRRSQNAYKLDVSNCKECSTFLLFSVLQNF